MRSSLAVLALTGLAACSRHDTTKAAPDTTAPPWKDVALVHSTATTPPRTDAVVVLLDERGVRLAGDAEPAAKLPARDAWAHGFEASAKRSSPTDLYLVPLHDRLERARDAGAHAAALVAVAGDIPYRPLVEVVFTLGQTEIPEVAFVVASSNGSAQIPLVLPHAQPKANAATLEALRGDAAAPPPPPPLAAATELSLTIILGKDGIAVKAAGGAVAPGCKDRGPGTTIPRAGAAHDFAALTACMSALRGLSPAFHDAHDYTLSALSEEPFSSVVGAFDAMRAAAFDRPSLGVAPR